MLKIKKNTVIDWLLALYIAGSYVFSLVEKYVIVFRLITVVLIAALLIYALRRKNAKIKFDAFLALAFAFMSFGWISTMWAKIPEYAIRRSITIAESLILIALVYNYVTNENRRDFFISSMAAAGTVYALYIVAFYGAGNYIRLLQNEERIGGELTNVNTIGVILAFSCIIYVWYILYEKKYIDIVPLLLNLVVSVGTGSKKVILCLVGGVMMLVMLKANNRKQAVLGIVETAAVGAILYFASQLSLFSAVNDRFGRLFAVFTGQGRADGSSLARLYYIQIGFEEFLKRPFWGVGLGNSRWITAQYVGKETYLHCNYVELLASVGVIGFLLYYGMYYILLKKAFKSGVRGNKYHILSVITVLLSLILQVASVTYYNKLEYMNLVFALCLIARPPRKTRQTEIPESVSLQIKGN